ncbi:MAG: AAA family ATPase [Candidatus Aminicenantes bacterium]|nr:AAA family ATPase [Candidatus Aminicenantes bacterium]
MSSSALLGQVLGMLILEPRLIESCELSATDFPAGRYRKIFEVLSELWENNHPEDIPLAVLAERIGGNGAATFTAALLDGLQKPTPGVFGAAVREMKQKALTARILAKIERQAKSGALNLEEVRADLVDYEALESPMSSFKPLSAVEPQAISELWTGRILFGMLNLLAGPPGGGKSVLTIAIAAIKSRDLGLPDSKEIITGCDSLFLCAEDPIAQAVRPRAEANGADLNRIFCIEAEDLDAGEIFGRLRQALAANPRIKFVVVDPLNAFLKSGTDYFRDPDVRRALLRPLAALAEETGAAVLGICHLNKRTDESGALNRIGGSVAYGAAARSVLALGLDPDNPERRLMAPVKYNYSKMPGTIAFTIGDGGRVEFEPNVVDIGADEILQRRDPGQAAEGNFAAEWLVEQLKGGPVDFKGLLQAAKKESIGRTTIFRVRKKVGVITRVSGFGQFKSSTWELPK